MDSEVTHPRTLALFRAVLYLAVFAAALALLGVGLSVLVATVVIAGVSLLLTGDPNATSLALLAGAGLLTTVGLAALLAFGARHLDRRVTAADRRPDPLDVLSQQYVDGVIDERTFERRVERLLDPEPPLDTHRLVRRVFAAARTRLCRRTPQTERRRGGDGRRRRLRPPASGRARLRDESSNDGRDIEPELVS
jgi:hypothetical protein